MARLANAPLRQRECDLPEPDKIRLCLQWLRNNPAEKALTAARIWKLQRPNTLIKKWSREKKKKEKEHTRASRQGGHNRILRPEQETAMIRYAAGHCIDGGKGATKQMLYNCAMYLRVQEGLEAPSWRWFQLWLKRTPELHTIKTKPIASHRVDIHTEQTLRHWFETEYRPALLATGVRHGTYVHNMDEKGARVCMPAGEEVVVPIGVKEMYTGIPENRLSVTIIECITANGRTIPPVVIVPGIMIMSGWFDKNMTGHELITVSESGYTNEGICMAWLDHFIKHNNCGPNSEWHILLLDGATCHDAPNFAIKAKMNKIWLVKFPSHQTHLLQPCDVGCFRAWKQYQQRKVMDTIRSFEPKYNLKCFFRDLKSIREKTFTVPTIKHSFQNAGIWPVSFKAIQKKLKEYGKKKKRDTGLDFLEYSSESETEDLDDILHVPKPIIDLQLEQEYILPKLPKLQKPNSFADCLRQLEDINPKITQALSSPTRAKYTMAKDGALEFLMLGSLAEMDLKLAKAKQIEGHKVKLNARASLQKGGSILASVALEKVQKKEINAVALGLRKAKTAVTRAENKAKEDLKKLGISDRKEERERKKWLLQHQAQFQGVVGMPIPPEKLVPIRDREKQQTQEEAIEARISIQSLYDTLAQEQEAYDVIITRDITSFSEVLIDPQILEMERQFRVKHNPLSQIRLESDDNNDIPSSPLGRMGINSDSEQEGQEGQEGQEMEQEMQYDVRSVATIDSNDNMNQDFIRFQ